MQWLGDASCSSFFTFQTELMGKAQAEVVVPVVGVVVVPVRHPTVPGVVVPAATTVHAVGGPTDTFPFS